MNLSRKFTLLVMCCNLVCSGSKADNTSAENRTVSRSATIADAPAPWGPVPNEYQMRYYKEELSAFLHFGVNTYTEGTEWGSGKEDPNVFNPVNLDCDQWIRELKRFGFKRAILTLKHHDGFTLYPTKWSKHSVESSRWRDGKGDVLKDFSDACTTHDMGVGIYLSPWDANAPCYPANVDPDYNDMYVGQLTEILNNPLYGNRNHELGTPGRFTQVWADGACGGNNKPKYDIVRWWNTIETLAPGSVMTQNMGATVRWNGREDGESSEPNWQTINFKYLWDLYENEQREDSWYLHYGEPAIVANPTKEDVKGGSSWAMSEADLSIRHSWFWHPKDGPKSPRELAEVYFISVGRGSPMLLNVPPNTDGKLEQVDIEMLEGFREILDNTFAHNLATKSSATATASSVRNNNESSFGAANVLDDDYDTYWTMNDNEKTGSITIDLGGAKLFDVIQIQEYIPLGQRIAKFKVEIFRNNNWEEYFAGQTIGYKRLVKDEPVEASKVRLTILESYAVPLINNISVYKADKRLEPKPLVPEGFKNIKDEAFTTTGTWFNAKQGLNGGSRCTSESDATVTFSFTGTRAVLTGFRNDGVSKVEVTIDGKVEPELLNLYQVYVDPKPCIIYTTPELAAGNHTIKLRLVNEKNPKGIIGVHVDDLYYLDADLAMFEIKVPSTKIREGEQMTFEVVRTGYIDPVNNVSVKIGTAPNTATHGRGYKNIMEVVTFAPGEKSKEVIVETTENDDVLRDVTFFLQLTEANGGILGINSNLEITVVNVPPFDPNVYSSKNPYLLKIEQPESIECEDMLMTYKAIREKRENNSGEYVVGMIGPIGQNGGEMEFWFDAPEIGLLEIDIRYFLGGYNNLKWSNDETGDLLASGIERYTPQGPYDKDLYFKKSTITVPIYKKGIQHIRFYNDEAFSCNLDKFDVRFIAKIDTKKDKDAVTPESLIYGAREKATHVITNITVPLEGTYGSKISWQKKSDSHNLIEIIGNSIRVKRPTETIGDQTVTLTAFFTKDGHSTETKDFDFVIKAYSSATSHPEFLKENGVLKVITQDQLQENKTGEWNLWKFRGYNGGIIYCGNNADQTQEQALSFTFTGTKAYITGEINNTHNALKMFIDGEYVSTISLYDLHLSGTFPALGLLGETPELPYGEHTVKLQVSDQKNASGWWGATIDDVYYLDNEGKGIFELSVDNPTVDEGDAVNVTVTLKGADLKEGENVKVNLTTGTGTAFPGRGFIPVNETLTFAKGETSKTAIVKTTANSDITEDINFYLQLTQPAGGAGIGLSADKQITVKNSEGAGIDNKNLFDAIEAAKKNIENTSIGIEVGNVAQDEYDTYLAAILAGEKILHNAEATQTIIDEGFTTISSATQAFNNAKMTIDKQIALATQSLSESDLKFRENDNATSITDKVLLPLTGLCGTQIIWSEKTDTENNIFITGSEILVTRPGYKTGDKQVIISASISKEGGASLSKEFTLIIKEMDRPDFLSGTGEQNNPYIITDAFEMGNVYKYPTKSFTVANDIDMKEAEMKVIGEFGKEFTGKFEGNNKTIKNVKVKSSGWWCGFFGFTKNATIQNLNIENLVVEGEIVVGGLVGQINGGEITNCKVSGSVTATGNHVGGLVGAIQKDNVSTISHCSVQMNVSGSDATGALVGMMDGNSTVKNCKTSGRVIGNESVGGVIGRINGGIIKNCFVGNMEVTAKGNYGGGLIGNTLTGKPITIENCESNAVIMGGLIDNGFGSGWKVGVLIGGTENDVTIRNCIVSGKAKGNARVGGAIGCVGGEVKTNTNTISNIIVHDTEIGRINTWAGSANLCRVVGTLYNEVNCTINNLYAETESTTFYNFTRTIGEEPSPSDPNADGKVVTKDGISKSKNELQSKGFYENLGFKFGENEDNPWKATSTYPTLWFAYDGTSSLDEMSIHKSACCYPNPIQDKLYIDDTLIIKGIEILTLDGIVLVSTKKSPVDVSMLVGGTYIVRITTANSTISSIVVKN